MKLKWKVFILTLTLIFASGLVISYKSFQTNKKYQMLMERQKGQEIAHWVSELLLNKIDDLEGAVRNLDKSTVETLKRMNVRYFAYAFESSEQWRIKWKLVGDTKKADVKKEVNSIPFSTLSRSKRTWRKASGELALVSPVETAESAKFKSGFLVFGVGKGFLSTVEKAKPTIELFISEDQNKVPLFGGKKTSWLSKRGIMNRSTPSQAKKVTYEGIDYIAASNFTPETQLWVVRLQDATLAPFLASSPFIVFLISLGFIGLILSLVIYRNLIFVDLNNINTVHVGDESRLMAVLHWVRTQLKSLRESIGAKEEPLIKLDIIDEVDEIRNQLGSSEETTEVIHNLGEWLDGVVDLNRDLILENKITMHTEVDDHVSVRTQLARLEELIHYLIQDSINTLINQKDRKITIVGMQKEEGYQLTYKDSRVSNLPKTQALETINVESTLDNIGGILSFGKMIFSKDLSVAEGTMKIVLNLESVDRVISNDALNSIEIERFEIEEDDTFAPQDIDFSEIEIKPITGEVEIVEGAAKEESIPVEAKKSEVEKGEDDFASQSIDQIISSFELGSLDFVDDEVEEPVAEQPEEDVTIMAAKDLEIDDKVDVEPETEVENIVIEPPTDDTGLVEFNTGEFSLKIRSPKKRDMDVNC